MLPVKEDFFFFSKEEGERAAQAEGPVHTKAFGQEVVYSANCTGEILKDFVHYSRETGLYLVYCMQ